MSGRWVWCPPGWRVVPEVPTADMRSELRRVSLSHVEEMWRAGCDAAPEPPSGWQYGLLPVSGLCLVAYDLRGIGQGWNMVTARDRVVGDEGEVEDGEVWWIPLPPPPEVKP